MKGGNEGLRGKEQAQEAKEENEGLRGKSKGADRVKGENKMHEGKTGEGKNDRIIGVNHRHKKATEEKKGSQRET